MFKLEDAIKVAKVDYNVGICWAIYELQKWFDCSYYWGIMDQIEIDHDYFDEINIKTRDNLYQKLGIEKLMNKAYEIVWQ